MSDEPATKKIKIDDKEEDCPPLKAFVVVLKSYHGWYCDSSPDDILIETRVFFTKTGAEKARFKWMLENIVEHLHLDREPPHMFKRSADPFVVSVRTKMNEFVDKFKDKKNWQSCDLLDFIGADADIEKIHTLFFERDEYANTHEEIFIQECN